MDDILKDALTYAVMPGVVYGTLLYLGERISNLLSHRITSQSELDEVVEKESSKFEKKHGRRFLFSQFNESDGGNASVFGYDPENERTVNYHNPYEGIPKINLIRVGGKQATTGQVIHELYHVYETLDKLPVNKVLKMLKYLFVNEPRAIIYGLKGIGT
ncbi:MAG: hypothetical protein U9O94_07910 [Nanoarchaeota archaeon]|nr:hypothetical protein [Nanoarchaeota archaeon]